jgi:hypothetical protein
MAKQLFTPDGVQAKLTELYALSDTDLEAQVNLIANDLKTWLGNNFTFTTAQSTYLSGIDALYIRHAGIVTATAVHARRAIVIVAPNPPSLYSSKYIKTTDSLTPGYDSVGGFTVGGSVTFTIGYTP